MRLVIRSQGIPKESSNEGDSGRPQDFFPGKFQPEKGQGKRRNGHTFEASEEHGGGGEADINEGAARGR